MSISSAVEELCLRKFFCRIDRQSGMGLFSALISLARTRVTARLIRRGLGGRLGTIMMLAYLAKEGYEFIRKDRRARLTA